MRTSIRTSRPGLQIFAVAWLCVATLAGPAASARADARLYEAIVPLQGASAEDRAAGMSDALRAVAVRASGRREAADNPTINSANPSKFVQRYSTTADKMLKVGFDGSALEELLQQAGLPLWPAERPVTVIEAPVTDVAAVEAVARWRGLPIEWGASGPAHTASAARAVLTGVPSGSAFTWTFTHDGRTAQVQGTAQDGIHLAADTLAARYAPPSTRSSSTVTLKVDGMDDITDYAGLLAYLRELSLVRDVAVESLDGTVITLRAVVRGDREVLARVAALDGRLQPVPQGEGDAAAVDFVFQP
jgi:hypothetical protein